MKRETLSPTIELLLKARGLIEDGWCQGFSHDGRVCAVEALWRIAEGPSVAVSLLQQALPARAISVMQYNDARTTTKADILALYGRAIDLALKAER
jgi:hypothetical protein